MSQEMNPTVFRAVWARINYRKQLQEIGFSHAEAQILTGILIQGLYFLPYVLSTPSKIEKARMEVLVPLPGFSADLSAFERADSHARGFGRLDEQIKLYAGEKLIKQTPHLGRFGKWELDTVL